MGPQFKKRNRIDPVKARKMYDKGFCDPDIADKLGVSRDAIREWRKRNGLEGHKASPKPKKPKKHVSNIAAIEAEARENGTSYGQHYMATRASFFEKSRGGKYRKASD